jgi:micrococcal nuclease
MRKPVDFADHPVPVRGLYRAVCKHVVDGDTFDFLIDLGFNQYAYATVRLNGVNTPEIFSGTEREWGKKVKTYVEGLLLNRQVELRTKPDAITFGRYVADVRLYVEVEPGVTQSFDLANHLLTLDMAVAAR